MKFEPGTTIENGGQLYRCEAIEPYTRRDGRPSAVAIVTSECAKCGEPFTLTVPAVVVEFKPNRRCQKHKRAGSRVHRSRMSGAQVAQ